MESSHASRKTSGRETASGGTPIWHGEDGEVPSVTVASGYRRLRCGSALPMCGPGSRQLRGGRGEVRHLPPLDGGRDQKSMLSFGFCVLAFTCDEFEKISKMVEGARVGMCVR
ncbi:hypothetical protein DER44DRAFT_753203 [Fusarium oxysporum]|nr:hypothetical protein DER44DRAFT_753203 [Fusarium oxysporum]